MIDYAVLLHQDAIKGCPCEVWAAAVKVGGTLMWPFFTTDKEQAERVVLRYNGRDGVSSVLVGPLKICRDLNS